MTGQLRPIYGPNDPRWAELDAWLQASPALGEKHGPIEEFDPSERAFWHAGKVLGEVHPFGYQDLEYPQPDQWPAPSWATGDPDTGVNADDYPLAGWHRTLATGDAVEVEITREDIYDPDADTVTVGAESFDLHIGGNDLDRFGWERDYLATLTDLRAIANVLLDAANTAERL